MSEKISECLKKQREYPRYLKNPNYRDGWIDAMNFSFNETLKAKSLEELAEIFT